MSAGAVPMLLDGLQGLLAGIYDVPVAHNIYDFLYTDRHDLPGEGRGPDTDEQLLVVDEGDSAAVGLFLDDGLLQRLNAANPLQTLNAGNLADYWTALEGVSHFLYLAWNAECDRPVTLLELELQAEIDKYVSSVWLLCAQDPTRFPAEVHRLLFERAHVDERLAGDRVALYREANQYAARFCRQLECKLRQSVRSRADALQELRRFYRLSRERKVCHIRRGD